MSDIKGKVIPFPKPKGQTPIAQPESPSSKPNKKRQGAIVSGVLALVVGANLYFRDEHKSNDVGRQIASVRGISEDTVWQQELVKDLSTKPLRGLATAGTQPQLIDQLQFGELRGQYKFEFEAGRIKSIVLTDSTSQPVELKNPENFVSRYKSVWQVPFESTVVGATRVEGRTHYKSVRLIHSGQPFGEVEFVLVDGKQLKQVQFKTSN